MEIGKFNLIKTEGRARRGEFCTRTWRGADAGIS